jgi:BirA family biotin operon repressor/biotin-[acetyl-CoA-carboxylase] ligase
MAVGVAVVEAIAPFVPQAQLKWPNDVVVAAADTLYKLGGIVIAIHPDSSTGTVCVVGIGLNLVMSESGRPIENARAISDFTPQLPELDELVIEVIAQLHKLFDRAPAHIHSRYVAKSCTLGKLVVVALANGERHEGQVEAITPDGAIEVKSGNVTQTFRTADIEHLFTA